ncbi:MAG: dihydroorotate dehydrogenase electron transfer subunit [Thermovenabulum sp.]|uniref:dihydroorotate dehydrogenase electron transfer subunit n=1 Tax=Thermovenabulum sp. TaxID=3100335 RepID=UPI003C7CEE95
MKVIEEGIILKNKPLGKYINLIKIYAPQVAKLSNPGQFAMLKVNENTIPLLRRPFSFAYVNKEEGEVYFCIKVVGEGTRLLVNKKPKEIVEIIGPLGNGFEIDKDLINSKKSIVLVGGGIGAAPLAYLAKCLMIVKADKIALLGARTKEEIILKSEFERAGFKLKISTDDGSEGHKMSVLELLLSEIENIKKPFILYACGPKGMLRGLKNLNLTECTIYASLEEKMACGMGACFGCSVKMTNGEYKRVCKDGPIFNIEEIDFEEENNG